MKYWKAIAAGAIALVCGLSVGACSLQPGGATGDRVVLAFEGDAPEWADTATSVMSELEQWRGLSFQEDVRVTFQSQSEPGLNGWYNSQTKQLVVAATDSERLGRSVLLHELFHALQDQRFDLYTLRQQSAARPDANRALSAIIEGEAMLAVSELMNYDFLAHARLPAADPIRDERFENIFLYGDGMKFITAVREAGGWEAVDRVFQDPPQSTTLIFNPDRYLAGEREPKSLDVPLDPGDRLQNQIARGEYQVRLLLARQPETRSLLDTFDGAYETDAFATIATSGGETVHRWAIAFSRPDVAADLVDAVAAAIATELDSNVTPTTSVRGSLVVAEWQTGDDEIDRVDAD